MTHLSAEFVFRGRCDEFAAVPTRRRLDRYADHLSPCVAHFDPARLQNSFDSCDGRG